MSELETMDLVKQGIALARGGDKPQARPLLRQAVEREPTNEAAWMWLASVAESPQDALTALERVLTLNPMNEKARTAAHAARLKVGVAAAKRIGSPTPARCLTLSSPTNRKMSWPGCGWPTPRRRRPTPWPAWTRCWRSIPTTPSLAPLTSAADPSFGSPRPSRTCRASVLSRATATYDRPFKKRSSW